MFGNVSSHGGNRLQKNTTLGQFYCRNQLNLLGDIIALGKNPLIGLVRLGNWKRLLALLRMGD